MTNRSEVGEPRRQIQMERAVVLLSGGIDSSTACAVAAGECRELFALSFDYGQSLVRELKCASRIAREFSVKDHRVIQLDLRQIGGSALTDRDVPLPVDRSENEMADIPVSYVPARNTIFLSIALAWAEVLDADAIYIGVNAVDYSGYPDCRPEYVEAFQRMADRATRRGVSGRPIGIRAPLLHMRKREIIELGLRLGVPYEHTWSCYAGGERPCGRCDSCILRSNAFRDAGSFDPALSDGGT